MNKPLLVLIALLFAGTVQGQRFTIQCAKADSFQTVHPNRLFDVQHSMIVQYEEADTGFVYVPGPTNVFRDSLGRIIDLVHSSKKAMAIKNLRRHWVCKDCGEEYIQELR